MLFSKEIIVTFQSCYSKDDLIFSDENVLEFHLFFYHCDNYNELAIHIVAISFALGENIFSPIIKNSEAMNFLIYVEINKKKPCNFFF